MIDQFAAALPSSRSVIKFENRANGVETSCDILIDLTGDTPLFTGWEKRDGYFRAAGDDVTALAAVEREASQMIGEFEKSQKDIDEVLKLEKRHFGALAGQGLVNIQLKNYEKAIMSYEKAQKIYPTMKSPKIMIKEIKELIKQQSI